ncbi:ADM_collapsed_G0036910.mRNA.1.CDS.1 [Saccharomyces cerevisiae]|nr:ADM_collapsed_G0036910.mRNA.1.CDS.1 [Saccharomyces cerevisiae]
MAHVQLLLLYFFVSTVKAFYLPGVAPTTYRENDNIPLLVNHLTPSMNYQHKDEDGNNVSGDKENFLYSYDYYYNRFHFCQPEKVEKQPESLGSVIFGDRIYNSPFQLNMLQEKECESLCKTVIPGDDAKFINKLIKNGFFQNWLIDGLPAAREVYDGRTKTSFYGAGFNLGFVQVTQGTDIEATPKGAETTDKDVELETRNDRNMVKTYELPYFANHFDIMIEYHDRGEGNYRVVGVIVEPVSIKRSSPGTCETTGSPLMLDEENDNEVYFTYSVKFNESATSWATRWDKYLHVYDPSIQWFSLINFSLVVVLLSSVVIHSLLRALKSDFARYNELNLDDDFQEDSGWKLNHGDVFRSPNYYGKPSETPKMEEEKLEVTNVNASSSKKVHKSKKSTSKYDQKNVFRNSMTGIAQILPTKPVKIIEQNIDFANPKSFDLLQSTHTICFNKRINTTNTKLNVETHTSSDIDNDILHVGAPTDLGGNSWVGDAKTGDLQEQFNIATVKLYESAEDGRLSIGKDKPFREENTGSDSLVRAEEDSTAVTNENGHISSEKNLKKDRRESIRNQILTLDLNDEDFFQNVMKVLSAIDEPELRQYVIVISELVTMEMDDGKTVREKLRDVELNINRLQVDIKEIKEMLVTLINK